MEKLIVASNNAGKIKEIKEILGGKYEILSMREAGLNTEVEETGTTFYENAYIKAKAVVDALGVNALADDSGLCVDYLDGAPSIYSARYSGVDHTDEKNRKLLLKNMQKAEDRTAKFCSCVVLLRPNGTVEYGYGETTGKILYDEEGDNGFGYDSIFYSDDLKKSFGLATDDEKNSVSHRSRAIKDLLEKL